MQRHAFTSSVRRHASALAFALVSAVSSIACGLPGEDLFGGRTSPSEGQGGAGSGGAPAGTGGDPSGASVSSTSAAESASSAAQASSVAQASSAAQTVASSAMASSSSGNPSEVVVYCAGQPCSAGDVCCYHFQNPNLDHCGSAGQCGDNYAEISCMGPDHCPGEICCGTYQGGYTGVSCQPTCSGQGSVVLCTDADSNVCPQNLNCGPSGSLGNGYDVCT